MKMSHEPRYPLICNSLYFLRITVEVLSDELDKNCLDNKNRDLQDHNSNYRMASAEHKNKIVRLTWEMIRAMGICISPNLKSL